jgi:chemotaxis signal transduction protein
MAPVIGLYDFRGAPVPVIDVSLKLAAGRTKRCDRPRPRILIAEVERHLVGLLVPKTAPITFHPRSSLVQAPRELSRAAGAYLLGMLKGDTGRFVYVLDIDALVRSLGR